MSFSVVGGVGAGGRVKPRSAARILTAFKGLSTPPRGLWGVGGVGGTQGLFRGHLGVIPPKFGNYNYEG